MNVAAASVSVAALVALGISRPADAQTRGNTQSVSDKKTFTSSTQGMWGGGSGTQVEKNLTLLSVQWNENGSDGTKEGFAGVDFGGSISARTNGTIELSARLKLPDGPTMGVTYPVRVELKFPESNSFRDGEEVAITSQFALEAGAAIVASPRKGEIYLGGTFGLGAAVNVEACFFGCFDIPIVPNVDIATRPFTIVSMTTDRGLFWDVPGIAPSPTLPYTFSGMAVDGGVNGTVGLPTFSLGATTISPDGRGLRNNATRPFIDLDLDLDKWLKLAGFPIPLGASANKDGVEVSADVFDARSMLQFKEHHEIAFDPNLQVELTLPIPVSYRVTSGATQVAAGESATIRFAVGQTLYVRFPSGRKAAMTAGPTYQLENEVSTLSELVTGTKFTQKVADVSLKVPGVEVIPGLLSSPSFGFHVGPLVSESQDLPSVTVPIFPTAGSGCAVGSSGCGRWRLGGFNTEAGTAFALDPEDPIILASTAVVSGLATRTGAAGTLTQTLTVANGGDVRLLTVQAVDALTKQFAAAGLTVNSVTSTGLTPNTAFNGATDQKTLAGSDVLPVGGTQNVVVNFNVAAGGVYGSAVTATGTSPIGTSVQASASARFAVFAFEFLQAQLTGAKGEVPAVVRGSPGLDPRTIDVASIRIDGVAPIKHQLAPRGGDWDLLLWFDAQALWPVLVARSAGGAAASVAASGRDEVGGADVLAKAVLQQGAAVSDAQRRRADDVGNRNEKLDVGDLRAAWLAKSGGTAPADAPIAAAVGPVVPGSGTMLPLTGRLVDTTPFMAEAPILRKN